MVLIEVNRFVEIENEKAEAGENVSFGDLVLSFKVFGEGEEVLELLVFDGAAGGALEGL